jgi:hypothetical protein
VGNIEGERETRRIREAFPGQKQKLKKGAERGPGGRRTREKYC